MKGAYSSPQAYVGWAIDQTLFPDTVYKYDSGGVPRHIPELSREQFLDFHRNHYHPSNATILLYGNGDLLKELAFINDRFYKDIEAKEITADIPLQKPFKQMKEKTAHYPVAKGEDTAGKTYLSLNFVTGKQPQPVLDMALPMISYILLNAPGAPLRQALNEADIGTDMYAQYANHSRQPGLYIVVEGADPEDKDRFKQVVFATLQKLVKQGIDKKMIQGAINRTEFRLREADYGGFPKGMVYAFMLRNAMVYGGDPFDALAFEERLKTIKQALTKPYFEQLIQTHILENPHSALVVIQPQPGLQDSMDKEMADWLAEKQAAMSEAELKQIQADQQALDLYHQTPDKPEDLAKLPLLSLQDIEPKAEAISLSQEKAGGFDVLAHFDTTNRIAYTMMLFDSTSVPQDLLPYMSLLSDVIKKMDTKNHTFTDINTDLNIHTGGMYFYPHTYRDSKDPERYSPKFIVFGKAVMSEMPTFMELAAELMAHTRFTDKERLRDVLNEVKGRLIQRMRSRGLQLATQQLGVSFSQAEAYDAQLGGLAYFRFVSGLLDHFDEQYPDIAAKLEQVRKLVFNRHQLTIGLICDKQDFAAYGRALKPLAALAVEKPVKQTYAFPLAKERTGIMTAAPVQFMAQGYNFRALDYDYSGKMLVLSQILSRDYLHHQVRVLGGAYGAYARFSRCGDSYFSSYRDPNLTETLDVFKGLPAYLQAFTAGDEEMTRYILGVVSRLDYPMTASTKGETAIDYHLRRVSQQDLQTERDQVLSTTAADIKAFAPMVEALLKQNHYCVYGNQEKLQQKKELFDTLVPLF